MKSFIFLHTTTWLACDIAAFNVYVFFKCVSKTGDIVRAYAWMLVAKLQPTIPNQSLSRWTVWSTSHCCTWLDFLKPLWTGERLNCCFPKNVWHRGQQLAFCYIRMPKISPRSEQSKKVLAIKSSRCNPLALTEKSKQTQRLNWKTANLPGYDMDSLNIPAQHFTHLLCHNQLSKRRHALSSAQGYGVSWSF